MAEKAGFVLEGTLRGRQRLDDGWHDVHLHSRLRDDPDADPDRDP